MSKRRDPLGKLKEAAVAEAALPAARTVAVMGVVEAAGRLSRILQAEASRPVLARPTRASKVRPALQNLVWYCAVIASGDGLDVEEIVPLGKP